jgi:hypothetical protein
MYIIKFVADESEKNYCQANESHKKYTRHCYVGEDWTSVVHIRGKWGKYVPKSKTFI